MHVVYNQTYPAKISSDKIYFLEPEIVLQWQCFSFLWNEKKLTPQNTTTGQQSMKFVAFF